jgi:hypothetical protein
MSRCQGFLLLLAVSTAIFAGLLLQGAALTSGHDREHLPELRRLGAALALTDLALWSEARYTRHPSQADLFTPFQDFPGAPEHFPAGSVIGPEALRRSLQAGQSGR